MLAYSSSLRRAAMALAFISCLLCFSAVKQARAFETGGDMSEVTWEEQTEGITFTNSSGTAIDPIAYAKSQHWTCIRLRLLVDGGGSGTALEQTLSYDLTLAKEVKADGMHLDLDIFYSDWWCDPGENWTPSEWYNDSYSQLLPVIQSYTASVITAFKNAGCLPDYVQIGNEINDGFLWPQGELSTSQSQFVGLLKAGIAGVKQVSTTPKIILHIADAADVSEVEWFYNTIASQCNYDIVGLSYYPSVGTNLSDIQTAMTSYKGMFGNRPIMLVEFGYPYSGSYTSGSGYWTTPSGQQQIIWNLCQLMESYSQGAGVLYWGSTYVTGSWGDESLFSTSGYPTCEAEPGFGSLWY